MDLTQKKKKKVKKSQALKPIQSFNSMKVSLAEAA